MTSTTALRDLIMEYVRPLQSIVEYVTDLVFADDGTVDCKGAKSDDEDGHPIKATTAWHLGFYSRPLDGAIGVLVKGAGKSGVSFLVGFRDKQYEISLDKGDVAVANAAGAVSKWDKNGKITHTAKVGQLVTVNGEDYSLLKTETMLADLSTLMGFLVTWVPLVVTAVSTAPSGTAADPGVATTAGNIKTAITNGSYKSTKAKNG